MTTTAFATAQIEPWGDQAIMVRLGRQIEPAISASVQALTAAVRQAAPAWLVDCVPSYCAVLIQFDPRTAAPADVDSFVRDRLAAAAAAGAAAPEFERPSRLVEIPVCYQPDFGPDLVDVAASCQLSVDEVIQRHAAPEYRVYMLGFRPGFPFLGTVDQRIAVPRLSTPRANVVAGSVGIAGQQTGIYPNAGPGGWRIIGRTPWRLFDASAPQPFRLTAGDGVRFVPIDGAEFARWQDSPHAH
ncbi:MAG TPA: 5-oxoprolinase subunit PxpB [Polyangia bacterium]|nr:5-oxoprolinase subunit PxpB [Polyangia bacterium]